ncbi:uncharacterized protein LOC103571073 [Microplitis demolitor]|uniref:uncharacterized protein LOC103571073 n=1 Tax=Microplitis demolitor TaxID=69319 RepID=UPI0004CCF1FE|nr:uncharacterized protein LOC103571073 [Microplitis demolitor]
MKFYSIKLFLITFIIVILLPAPLNAVRKKITFKKLSLTGSQSPTSSNSSPNLPSTSTNTQLPSPNPQSINSSPLSLNPRPSSPSNPQPSHQQTPQQSPVSSNDLFPKLPSHPSPNRLVESQNIRHDDFLALRSSNSLNNFPFQPSPSRFLKAAHDKEFPALNQRTFQSSNHYPVERSSSLNLNPSVANSPWTRGGSVDSPRNRLNSPVLKKKNWPQTPGSSSSLLTSSSGYGRSLSTSSGSSTSLNSGASSPGTGNRPGIFSKRAHEEKPVAVSDKTCKDDNSPADQCFNYFVLSIFWPPALGFEYISRNKPVNDNINLLKWSIHGLWPATYGEVTPENCKKRTSVSFSQHRLASEKGLRASLESKWFNLCPYKLYGSSLVSFWDREFSKHGICATRSPFIASDVGYFKMAVNLFDRVNVAGILSAGNFKPGDKIHYGDIVEMINDAVGSRIKVDFIQDKTRDEAYLKEIKVCYNLKFRPINCPGTKLLTEEVRNKEITYLDHAPAAQ